MSLGEPEGTRAGSQGIAESEFGREPRASAAESRVGYAVPVLVGFSIVLVSLLTSAVLRNSENRALEAATNAALDTITTEIEQGIDRQLYGVITHAWKWDWQEGQVRDQWSSGARSLIEQLPLLRGIAWIDEDYAVLVSEPEAGTQFRISDVSERAEILEALKFARESRRIIGLIAQGVEGEKILMVHIAIHRQDEAAGYVIGAYGLESLLSNIFVTEPSGFRVEVSSDDGPIWTSAGSTPSGVPVRFGNSSTLNLRWKIGVSPGVGVVGTYRTWLPAAIAVAGGFLGLLTGLALFMVVDGRRKARWLELTNARLRDEMALRDAAERARKDVEEELSETLNSLPVHVWSARVSSDGEFTSRRVSTVLAEISGRPIDFFDGRPESWLAVIHPEDRPRLEQLVTEVVSGRKEHADYEYRLVRPDGSIRHMSDSVRTTHVGSSRRLDGLGRDITEMKEGEDERRRLEARFQQAQKLESLGVLAGGIAHDFNNLLVAMLGHARLADEDLPADSPIRQNLQSVIKAARQAGELCGQMLAYAGKVPIITDTVELEEVVKEMGELLRASIPSSTFIRYAFDKEVPCLSGDASQIRQVALNLLTNASEAIGDGGGEITLTVQLLDCAAGDLAQMEFAEGLTPGPYVALGVSDTGIGMDEATRKKIFEPFYSTKFAGRGLGLAAVVGIVRGHGGAIRIESEEGQGTSISVLFPASDAEAQEEIAAPEKDAGAWRGEGKILLVEDEESARELARIVLERAGIEVVEAADGMEALAIFGSQPEAFGGVLLDLTMPNLDGVETYSRLRAIRPDIQVILCSGYPEQAAMARFADLGLAGFLKKPYDPDELLACMQGLGHSPDFASS
jgi:PAS domain S-box-containing protein